ncbi:hypothetical protein GCM10023322_19600 [Rugosimonospora acidiphila]|uniref:DUF3105 domain-containing protein n=1 Tax=Rugosimonospora acidiphila TaxID=556531 RepID=A0ABP9RNK8_9ACTN
MSISTPQAGGNRRPSSKPAAGGKPAPDASGDKPKADAADARTPTDKPARPAKAARSGATSGSSPRARTTAAERSAGGRATGGRSGGGNRPPTAGRGGGGGRPPITPVKINQGRHWGPVALISSVSLVAAAIVVFAVYEVHQNGRGWQSKADAIQGIVDYRKTETDLLKPAQHAYGKINYPQSPPVGGTHNYNWERCQGDVYPDQIPNENAVHALEHGAVWVTYNPSLPKDEVDQLASKVRGNDFMLMSPYPGLDKPISLQAWGFQLKLDHANDPRIDQFIKDLRVNATMEPGVTCGQDSGSYVTKTGPDPANLGQSGAPAPAGMPSVAGS